MPDVDAAAGDGMSQDQEPPSVTGTNPTAGAADVPLPLASIAITFSEPMDAATIGPSTITFQRASGSGTAAGTVMYDPSSFVATFTPASAPTFGEVWTGTVSTAVTDANGNALAQPYQFSFTMIEDTTAQATAISGQTRADQMMFFPAATNASGMLAVWYSVAGHLAYQRNNWSFVPHGGGAAIGAEITVGIGSTVPQLAAWGADAFILSYWAPIGSNPQVVPAVSFFQNGAWSAPASRPPGTMTMAAVNDVLFNDTTTVTRWDGTTGTPLALPDASQTLAAATPAGKYAITYRRNTTTTSTLYARVHDGTAWGAEGTLATTTLANGITNASLVSNGTSFLAVWVKSNGTTSELESAQYDGTWNTTVLDTNTGTAGWSASAIANGAGYAAGWVVNGNVFARTYASGTWSSKAGPFGTSAPQPPALFANGSSVFMNWPLLDAFYGTVFSGGSWSSTTTIFDVPGVVPWARVATHSSGYAVGYRGTADARVRMYVNGSWLPSEQLAPQGNVPDFGGLDGTYAALYGSEGHMRMRPFQSATNTFGAARTLSTALRPAVATGPRLAVAANGKAFAVWQQFDLGRFYIHGSYFDGTTWGTPIRMGDDGSVATVAIDATGSKVAVTYLRQLPSGPVRRMVVGYANGVLGTPVDLGFGVYNDPTPIASDGSGFVMAWTRYVQGYQIVSRTSADGTTWSSESTVDAPATNDSYEDVRLVGNASGVALAYLGYQGAIRRVRTYANGTWSPATMLFAGRRCDLAAGVTEFAIACANSSQAPGAVGAVYAQGAWTTSTITTTGNYDRVLLAGAGPEFRALFGTNESTWNGTAWSTPSAMGGGRNLQTGFSWGFAAKTGGYVLVRDSFAAGVLSYTLDTAASGGGPLTNTGMLESEAGTASGLAVGSNGEIAAAAWDQVQASKGVPVIHARVGL